MQPFSGLVAGNQTALYVGIALTILALTVVKFVAFWHDAAFEKKNGCKPAPSIQQRSWLFGCDIVLKFHRYMMEGVFFQKSSLSFEDYGKTFSMKIFGSTRIWTIQPENVRTILQATGTDYELSWVRIRALRDYLGDATQSSNGETWAHGRALLRPSFTRAQVTNLDMYEEHFQKLAALIPDKESTIDLKPLFHRLTTDVATEYLFGESVDSLQPVISQEIEELEEAMGRVTTGIITKFNLANLVFLHWNPTFYRSVRRVHQYVQKFVSQALEYRETVRGSEKEENDDMSRGKRHIFIESLARDTGDRKVLQDQLISVLVAGRGTVASLLSNLFYLLARHPEVEKKLRAELSQLNGKIPTYEQLKQLPYLKRVIDESLRFYPPAPVNERQAMRDTILPLGGGPDGTAPIHIRKGQSIFYHTYAMHRSTDLWGPDAEVFRPERWEEWNGRSGWRYTPFGGGSRICPGQELARTETMFFVTRLLQTFSRLENRDDEKPFRETVGIVFSVPDVLVSMSR